MCFRNFYWFLPMFCRCSSFVYVWNFGFKSRLRVVSLHFFFYVFSTKSLTVVVLLFCVKIFTQQWDYLAFFCLLCLLQRVRIFFASPHQRLFFLIFFSLPLWCFIFCASPLALAMTWIHYKRRPPPPFFFSIIPTLLELHHQSTHLLSSLILIHLSLL